MQYITRTNQQFLNYIEQSVQTLVAPGRSAPESKDLAHLEELMCWLTMKGDDAVTVMGEARKFGSKKALELSQLITSHRFGTRYAIRDVLACAVERYTVARRLAVHLSRSTLAACSRLPNGHKHFACNEDSLNYLLLACPAICLGRLTEWHVSTGSLRKALEVSSSRREPMSCLSHELYPEPDLSKSHNEAGHQGPMSPILTEKRR